MIIKCVIYLSNHFCHCSNNACCTEYPVGNQRRCCGWWHGKHVQCSQVLRRSKVYIPFAFLFLLIKLKCKISDFIPKCRKGSRYGHDSLVDGMLKDGLWDVYNDCAMGTCAELCADKHTVTREEQVFFKTHFLIP